MSAPTFTPGPWHVANSVQIRSERDQIAKVWMMRNGEGNANASLIAAAPELYEALEIALNWLASDTRPAVMTAHVTAVAALAKARGES
jgi:hypothetical protein